MQKLPDKASSYLQENFMDASLTKITETKDSYGKSFFLAELESGDIVYQIEFNSTGDIIRYETKPLFNDDYSYGDVYPEDSEK